VDVAKRLHVIGLAIAVDADAPGEPAAVHLVGELDEDRFAVSGQTVGPAIDIAVVVSAVDGGETIRRLVRDMAFGVVRLPVDDRGEISLVDGAQVVAVPVVEVAVGPVLVPDDEVRGAADRLSEVVVDLGFVQDSRNIGAKSDVRGFADARSAIPALLLVLSAAPLLFLLLRISLCRETEQRACRGKEPGRRLATRGSAGEANRQSFETFLKQGTHSPPPMLCESDG
jgi:hypothetical protein